MANVYDIGSLVQIKGTFTNTASGLNVDPTTVFAVYTINGGTEVVIPNGSISHPSLGNYTSQIDTTGKAGEYWYRFYSTGTGQASKGGVFVVTAEPA